MKSEAELEEVVATLAAETFGSDIVEAADCRRGEDHEGAPVVWVTLLIRDGRMPIGAQKTFPFGGLLWDAFRQAGETAYPILSFVPTSEFSGVYPAAA